MQIMGFVESIKKKKSMLLQACPLPSKSFHELARAMDNFEKKLSRNLCDYCISRYIQRKIMAKEQHVINLNGLSGVR